MRSWWIAFGCVGAACGGTVINAGLDASDDVAIDARDVLDDSTDASTIDARSGCLTLLAEVDYARACALDSAVACTSQQGPAFGDALFECILKECATRSGFSTCGSPMFTFSDAGCFNGGGGCCNNGLSDYDAYVAWDDCVSAAVEGPRWLCAAGGAVAYSGCVGDAAQ